MDLHFESDNTLTLRLIEGNGPVHIAAQHVVGLYNYALLTYYTQQLYQIKSNVRLLIGMT